MRENRRAIGNKGERAAEEYLTKEGCRILCRNYTAHGGEIDLVADYKEYLLFVEVKLRKLGSVSAAGAIDEKKRERLIIAAEQFLSENADHPYISLLKPRFDAVEVYTSGGNVVKLHHIINIFADV